MIDANKLQNTIEELESNSKTLKRVAELYEKLEAFGVEFNILYKMISEDGNILKSTESQISTSIEELNSQLVRMPEEASALRKAVEKGGATIREEIVNRLESLVADQKAELRALLNDIQFELSKMPDELVALRKEVDKGSAAIRQEIINCMESLSAKQKTVIESFLGDIGSLLTKHRSDIEVAIRNEGAQVQRGLENIVNEKHIALQSIFGQHFSDMSYKLAKQGKYSFIGIAFMGMNVALALAILWMLRY